MQIECKKRKFPDRKEVSKPQIFSVATGGEIGRISKTMVASSDDKTYKISDSLKKICAEFDPFMAYISLWHLVC